MSAQPPAFGQPSTFGGPAAPEPAAAAAEEPATSGRKTVIIAVAAGVVALGVLGGAAALVLGGGEGDVVAAVPPAPTASVEPSVAPTLAPATPLPTAVIKGRNVFAPLIEVDASGAAVDGESVVDVGAVAPAATATSTTGSSLPTGGSTAAPLPGGGGGLPVVEYVEVPGPTVTVTVDGEEVLVPGPTQTVEVEKVVEVAVPGASFDTLSVVVEEVVERDDDGALVGVSYPADFFVDDADFLDVLPGSSFGEKKEFRYISYAPVSQSLSFIYGSSLFTVTVPLAVPEPTPSPTEPTATPTTTP